MSRNARVDPVVAAMEKMEKQRQARRNKASKFRRDRKAEEKRNEREGRPGDVDFQRLIKKWRKEHLKDEKEHAPPGQIKIVVCARKRPVSSAEKKRKDFDAVTCLNPKVIVHAAKLKVDGITKYLDNTNFKFDHSFDEDDTNEDVYTYVVQPLVHYMFRRGRGTVFAYGQTGSGKTYTMNGIQRLAAEDIFRLLGSRELRNLGLTVHVSFFELYGGRCRDLLFKHNKVEIREDGHGRVVAQGLQEQTVSTVDEMLAAVKVGNGARATHATEMNSVSSRSHAVCDISVREASGKLHGKISLVDLAGSERATDTKNHNRQRRMEGAAINQSLLALKECVRALNSPVKMHVPYRASKLTMILRDSFTDKQARVVMIVNVSPVASHADHTHNTLRYADRLKESDKKGAMYDPDDAPQFTFTIAPGAAGAGSGAGAGSHSSPASPTRPSGGRSGGRNGGHSAPSSPRRAKAPSPLHHIHVAVAGRRAAAAGNDAANTPLSPTARLLRRASMAATNEEKTQLKRQILDEHAARHFAKLRGIDEGRDGAAAGDASTAGSDGASVGSNGAGERRRGRGRGRGFGRRRGADGDAGGEGQPADPSGAFRHGEGALPRDPPQYMQRPRTSEPLQPRSVVRQVSQPSMDSHRKRQMERLAGRRGGGHRHGAGRRSEASSGVADAVVASRPSDAPDPDAARNRALELELNRDLKRDREREHRREQEAVRVSEIERKRSHESGLAADPVDEEVAVAAEEVRHRQEDLKILHQTMAMRGEAEGLSNDWLDFNEAVSMIVEQEGALLNSHKMAIQQQKLILAEEEPLLASVMSPDVVEYDIDGYVAKLDELLRRKIRLCGKLKRQLDVFKKHLEAEEAVAKRAQMQGQALGGMGGM